MLEKRIFTGGMDSDSTAEAVSQTDYRKAINCRINSADQDSIFAVENVKGNTLVSYTLPAGTNKAIGMFEDKVRKKVYYWVWNEFDSHIILEYDEVLGLIAKVLQSSLLNFDKDHLITGINTVEVSESSHLLYWTDDYNEPFMINIEKAKLHSQGDYTAANGVMTTKGYPQSFILNFLYRIKEPPQCQPTVSYGSDSTKNVNYLENKLFQFKYAYIYNNYEHSATSAISVPALPSVVCNNVNNSQVNNYISVVMETGTEIVQRIQVFARLLNIGDFFLIADLDKDELCIPSNSTYTYRFYNDGVYNTIDLNYSNNLYDRVPLKSKAQELIK